MIFIALYLLSQSKAMSVNLISSVVLCITSVASRNEYIYNVLNVNASIISPLALLVITIYLFIVKKLLTALLLGDIWVLYPDSPG